MFSFDVLKTDKWIIFPYKNGKLIEIDEMEKTYPKTMKYFYDMYEFLLPRNISKDKKGRDVPFATEDTWYRYGREQMLKGFDGIKKLIVGVMGKDIPMYMFDEKDFIIASGGTAGYVAISEKENTKYKLEYLQAYLSHPLIEKIVESLGSDFEGGFYSRGTGILKKLPIKDLNFENSVHKNLYENVVNYVKEIHEINVELEKNLTKRDVEIYKRNKDDIVKRINYELDKIFEL